MGALAITGVPGDQHPFEPLVPGAFHVANTNRYRSPSRRGDGGRRALRRRLRRRDRAGDRRRGTRDGGRGATSSRCRTAGGCFHPARGYFARVREICDRYGVLLVSDEVICAFGASARCSAAERYGYLPDMITIAKGVTSRLRAARRR